MDYVNLRPRAKINVSLDILGKLENGYHEVRMIMQTLRLHDDLFIKKTNREGIVMKTNHPLVPVCEKNLAYAACKLIMREFNINCGLYIDLFKRIPVAAGLGGGSSDAASALKGMRKLFSLSLSNSDLMKIAQKLGADVPFFISGGTALACGIGEKLTPLPKHPYVHVLICKPDFNISTAGVYKEFKIENVSKRPVTDKIINALPICDLKQITANMSNVLETVTEQKHPVITEIKKIMKKHGALHAMMSGSGPSVFGYFIKRRDALNAGYALYKRLGPESSVIFTGTY